MNDRARRRAIRNFVASILMSNLSRQDVYEISEDLSFGSLGRELGEALREAAFLIREMPSERLPSNMTREDDIETLINKVVQKQKLTKRALVQVMAKAAPRLMKDDVPSGTTKSLIEWFASLATETQISRLLSLLSDKTQDPYLKGIVRRG